MKRLTASTIVALCFWAIVYDAAHAQQATERYIPIGESPGVSASRSIIGTIAEVDPAAYEMTVRGRDELKTVKMTGATRYYLDRTKYKRSNQTTNLGYCKVGQRVEVKLNERGIADWVKIETD